MSLSFSVLTAFAFVLLTNLFFYFFNKQWLSTWSTCMFLLSYPKGFKLFYLLCPKSHGWDCWHIAQHIFILRFPCHLSSPGLKDKFKVSQMQPEQYKTTGKHSFVYPTKRIRKHSNLWKKFQKGLKNSKVLWKY